MWFDFTCMIARRSSDLAFLISYLCVVPLFAVYLLLTCKKYVIYLLYSCVSLSRELHESNRNPVQFVSWFLFLLLHTWFTCVFFFYIRKFYLVFGFARAGKCYELTIHRSGCSNRSKGFTVPVFAKWGSLYFLLLKASTAIAAPASLQYCTCSAVYLYSLLCSGLIYCVHFVTFMIFTPRLLYCTVVLGTFR